MKYIEKFNPLTRHVEDGFPDCSFSFCRNIHFIGKSLIDGKLVSWVINENLIPGYDLETKKHDPAYNPPTDEVYPFTVDFIKALEDNNSKCVPESAITAFRNNYREMMGITLLGKIP